MKGLWWEEDGHLTRWTVNWYKVRPGQGVCRGHPHGESGITENRKKLCYSKLDNKVHAY